MSPLSSPGAALQIQCYQCEEMKHDCSTPEHIVNCTVNVQDMCQKEVLVKSDGNGSITPCFMKWAGLHLIDILSLRSPAKVTANGC